MISLGLGTVVGGNGSSFGGFTPEYVTLLSKATSLGYTLPTAANQANQNKLIVDLKSAGVWDKLDVFYMFANTGSKEFALLNWKNPNSFNASAVGAALTWNSSGYVGGLLSYLNTNYNPTTNATNLAQNNVSMGLWKRTHDATAGKFMCGNSGASSYFPSVSGNDVRLHHQSGTLSATFALSTTGLLILNRTASTAVSWSVNGSATSGTTAASVAPVNANYSVFTYGTATASTYLGQISSFFLGASIVSETPAFYTAMNSYIATT
jgi:hypothetical protein